jgi:hypothetical protein
MDTIKQVSAALVKAQRAFGPALKDKTNPAFRSKYADLGACLDAVMDALNARKYKRSTVGTGQTTLFTISTNFYKTHTYRNLNATKLATVAKPQFCHEQLRGPLAGMFGSDDGGNVSGHSVTPLTIQSPGFRPCRWTAELGST